MLFFYFSITKMMRIRPGNKKDSVKCKEKLLYQLDNL